MDKSPSPSDDAGFASRAEQFAGDVLDGSAAEPPTPMPVGLSDQELRSVADHLWMDSLLRRELSQTGQDTIEIIDTVLGKLKSETAVSEVRGEVPQRVSSGAALRDTTMLQPIVRETKPRRFLRWLSPWVAAILLIAIGLFWRFAAPPSALAVVERAHQASIDEHDRTYDVSVKRIGGEERMRPGQLVVRGGTHFLMSLQGPGPFGAQFRFGQDGEEYWFLPPIGPGVVHNRDGLVKQWQQQVGQELPFLQIATLLERLKTSYDLTVDPPGRPRRTENAPANPDDYFRLEGTKLTDASMSQLAPQHVVAWIHKDSFVVHHCVTEFVISPESKATIEVELSLKSTSDHPSDYYRLESHSGNRRVIDLRNP